MIVYAYFNPVVGMPCPFDLLSLWKRSWERRGWKAKVLSRADCLTHPLYSAYLTHVSKLPSVNPRGYDLECFMRWLAFLNVIRGSDVSLMVDYDAINRSLLPADIPADSLMIQDAQRVPCCVSANREGAQRIVDDIMALPVPSQFHYSDQSWFREESPYLNLSNCRGISQPEAHTAKVWHFSYHDCREFNKRRGTATTREYLIRELVNL